MALQKQVIPKLFGTGIDTKSNPQVSVGPVVLENAVFNQFKKIEPRNGYTSLGKNVLGGSTLTNPNFLSTFNDELLLFQNTTLYSYSETNDAWIDKGNVTNVKVSKSDIIKNTSQQTNADSNTNNGVSVYAWDDSRGGIRYSVVDENTGAFLINDVSLSSTGTHPKVIASGYYIFIYYIETTNLKQARVDIGNPTVAPTIVTLANDISATYKFHDVTKFSAAMVGTYVNTGGNVKVYYATQNQEIGNGVNGYPVPVTLTQVATHALSIYSFRDVLIFISGFDLVNGTSVTRVNTDLTIASATTLIDASTTITNSITMIEGSSSSVYVYYTVTAASTINTYIKLSLVPLTGIPGALPIFAKSVGLAGKAFMVNSFIYVPTVFDTTLQPTYFLIRGDRYVIARYSGLSAGGLQTNSMLSEYSSLSTTNGFMAFLQKGPLLTETGKAFTQTGVVKFSFDFNSNAQFSSFQIGRNLHVAGGYLQNYDGNSVTEHGFHVFPETTKATVTATAGVLNGTYSYVAVYEWTDAQGQIHRSAPSTPVTVSPVNFKVDITVPTLRLTSKQGNRTNVVLAIYRTKTLGTVFYRITSITAPTYNDVTVDTITYSDNATDASISGNELLYTTGGVVENIAPPACQFVKNFNNRILLGGLEEPNQIWFSKFFSVGQGIGFSDQFVTQVDTEGGNLSSLGVLDDKVIIFKPTQIYFFSGDGPTDTGAQNNFTQPQRIATDSGCSNFYSIVVGPSGLYYFSQKGIYQLDRTMNVSYIGAPAERFNTNPISSAVLVASQNQVRFLTQTSGAVVHDYYMGQWTNFTPHNGKSSVMWKGVYTYITIDNRIFKENKGSYLDDAQSIKMRITTEWMSFAQVQGYMRVYKFNVLGEYRGPHRLVVKIGYDFEPAFAQQVNFNSTDIFGSNYYGQDTYYGQSTPFGGDTGVYQYRVNTRRQKIEAIRVSIEDVFSGTGNQGCTLTGLEFEVGVKTGGMKIPVARSGG